MVKKRNGEQQKMWAFTKVVRLRRYGRKRLVMVHEQPDLSDPPRFLLTDAQHWESTRVIETWSYRWSSEIFHEFTKQVTGLESAQVRNEQAVKRHLCLSCKSAVTPATLHRSRWEIREILVCKWNANAWTTALLPLTRGIGSTAGICSGIVCSRALVLPSPGGADANLIPSMRF
jgi:hypothetical protein